MEQNKEYYAFISYKREDEKWAKWLQNKLEHYKFPTNLNGRTDLPKNIRPTFRDVTDSTPGFLEKVINNALLKSEWLIVICSPRSAKSPWVCKEAQTFIDLGRADHIIPFIIEGIPFSNDVDTECYPDALLNLTGSKELLAANISEGGRDFAAVKVVARMFDLNIVTLWQRWEREQRRKRWMWTGIALLVGLVGLVIAGYFIKQNRTIENQNERLREDTIVMKTHLYRIQCDSIKLSQKNDSIEKQNNLILSQEDRILQQRDEIATERDNLKTAKYAVEVSLARILAAKANSLVDEGDSYMARHFALQALPPVLPYTEEAEYSLRKSFIRNNAILRSLNGDIRGVDISPDGRWLVSLAGRGLRDNSIRVWDIHSGKEVRVLAERTQKVNDVKFSPNGNIIVAAFKDGTLRFYNNINWQKTPIDVTVHDDEVLSVAFHPFGNLLATSSTDGTIRIWNIENLDKIHIEKTLLTSEGGTKVFFNSDGNFLISFYNRHNNGLVKIWDYANKKVKDSIRCVENNEYQIRSVAVSPKDKYVAMSSIEKVIENEKEPTKMGFMRDKYHFEEAIYLLDGKTHEIIHRLTNPFHELGDGLVFNDDESLLACSFRDCICLYDTKTGKRVEVKPEKSSGNLDFWRNSIIAFGNRDGDIKLWDIKDRYIMETLSGSDKKGKIKDAVFSHSGEIVGLHDTSVAFWNKKTNQWNVGVHSSGVIKFIIGHSGNEIVTMSDQRISLYKKEGGKWVLQGGAKHPYKVSEYDCHRAHLAFPNRKYIITGYDKTIHIWDVETFKVVRTIDTQGEISCITCSSDGMFFAVGSYNSSINVYSLFNNNLKPISLTEHEKPVLGVSFSPDTKMLASVSSDKTLKIWNLKYSKCINTKRPDFDYYPDNVKFICDGRYVVISEMQKTNIYSFPSMKLIAVLDDAFCDENPKGDVLLFKKETFYSCTYFTKSFPSIKQLIKKQ